MDTLAIKEGQAMALLEGLAMQAQTFARNAYDNLMQLGRVFTEAKPLVAHGEWEKWVEENAGMNPRAAQNCMQAYKRFGGKPEYEKLEKSKIIALMGMTEEQEQRFTEENDPGSMTTRQIREAVKKAREEARAEMQAEINAANSRAEEAESRPPRIPDDIAKTLREKDDKIAAQENDIAYLQNATADAINDRNNMEKALNCAKRDLNEAEKALKDSQEQYDRVQNELLNTQSVLAKGDAERTIRDRVTAEDFASAVRGFIGSMAQVPYMRNEFAHMDNEEYCSFDRNLQAMENFCQQARTALETISGEGTAR